jgi:hypothetical protein
VNKNIDIEFRSVINPDEVITWADLNGTEEMAGPSSWYNDIESKACVKICCELRVASSKSISIVTKPVSISYLTPISS